VKEFKKGPFIIANAVDAPILPVTIAGTDQAWAPGDWRMYGGKARVVIHPLVEQSGTPTEMRSQIETLIRATYEDLTTGA
jgi:1-acyl-sn-glycerol-3-phosphate acyltransferase